MATGGSRDLASIGSLVADQARCRMLLALADGGTLPAGRLAAEAMVTAATASSHLRKLTAGGLLKVEAAGRRRNYRLSRPEVAVLIEALERLAPATPALSLRQSQEARAWRQARVCYDHLAGSLGVEVMRAMIDHRLIAPSPRPPHDTDESRRPYVITPGGRDFLAGLGVAAPPARQPVRHHLDSTEDGPHLSGALGRALLSRFVELGWLQRQKARRLMISPDGRAGLGRQLGIDVDQ
jgi:DNA-binding transcriptional ArsR family regulator